MKIRMAHVFLSRFIERVLEDDHVAASCFEVNTVADLDCGLGLTGLGDLKLIPGKQRHYYALQVIGCGQVLKK